MEPEYLAAINYPMDLTTLSDYLQGDSLIDEEDFYQKVLSIFQNAVDFNSIKHDTEKEEIEDGKEEGKEKEEEKEKEESKEEEEEFETDLEREEDPITRRIVSRSSHLVQYTKWLCLEALPVVADKDRENRLVTLRNIRS